MQTAKILKGKKGQAVVAVIFLMIFSLAIGVSISSRFTGSLRSLQRTDDSVRALKAAEAGAEKFLVEDIDVLEDYVDSSSCGAACTWTVDSGNGQASSTVVELSYVGNENDLYILRIMESATEEVSLEGLGANKSVDICWNDEASIYASYVYEAANKITGSVYAYNASGQARGNGFSTPTALHGYASCFTLTTSGTPLSMRLHALYASSVVYLIPQSGTMIPIQGVLIKSTGTSGGVTKIVQAVKSRAILSPVFDYVLYQKSTSDPLSNR